MIENQHKIAWGIILSSVIFLGYLALCFEGTGDDGDSVLHYLYARWAYIHPEHHFQHWAKPVYILFTAPVAQLGFSAIKIMNVLLFGTSQFLAFAVAKKLDLRNAWLVPLFMVLAPMECYLTPSGLTEPMWAFWFILSIYLTVNERFTLAAIFISFLPFVRSEGLIIFCIYAPYLAFKRQYWQISLLAVGHLFYMFAGANYYDGNILWVFNKLGYATLDSSYGEGNWFTFINQLRFFMGSAMRLFLFFGVSLGLFRLIQYWRGKGIFRKEELWLVYGCSAAYFVGHSAFWALGIFNSFGLARVLLGIMPTFAIIITIGFDFIWEKIHVKNALLSWVFFVVSIAWIAQSSYKYFKPSSLALTAPQIAAQKAIATFGESLKDKTIYSDVTSFAYFLGTDYFDGNKHRHISNLFDTSPIPSNSIIFWDDWYSPTEQKVSLEMLQKDARFEQINVFSHKNESVDLERKIYAFKVK
jgi:hypothetical protein